MHFSPSSPNSNGCATPGLQRGQFCKIVTFYEDFEDAVRAGKKFDAIARAFSAGLPVRATSWSFSLLGKPELNTIILDDVSHADVLVVASDGNHELPGRMASWVEICLHALPEADPVIVALHDERSEGNGGAAPMCSSLESIAHRMDATFMCPRDLASVHSEAPAGPIRPMQVTSDSVLETAQYPAAESVRWWGIND